MQNVVSDAVQKLSPYIRRIRNYCITNEVTVAVAESVTSGAIQLLLSTGEKATDFFQGGITVYNGAQKAIQLGIDPVYAEKHNGVSEHLSAQLAMNVCELFRAQIGIGITGYANPVPEQGIQDTYAYLAIVRHGKIIVHTRLATTEKGINAQMDYAITTIQELADALDNQAAV